MRTGATATFWFASPAVAPMANNPNRPSATISPPTIHKATRFVFIDTPLTRELGDVVLTDGSASYGTFNELLPSMTIIAD